MTTYSKALCKEQYTTANICHLNIEKKNVMSIFAIRVYFSAEHLQSRRS